MSTEPATFILDVPRREDAHELARIHVDGWRLAYGDLLDDSWFGPHAMQQRIEQWTRRLTSPVADGAPACPRGTTRIGRDADGTPIGFAIAGRCRDEPAPRRLEVWALYIDEAWFGSGLAAALVEDVIGQQPATVWVAEGNPRARAFYAKIGFAADGERRLEEDIDQLAAIRMVR